MKGIAQPVLPDLTCTAENGNVSVSWNSQYAGLKSVTVLRSADSIYDFKPVGEVKKPVKGTQSYLDISPLQGRNFYKLNIIFGSGVSWASNICKCMVAGVGTPGTVPQDNRGKDTEPPRKESDNPPAVKKDVPAATDIPQDNANDRLPRKKIVVAFDDPTEQPNTFIRSKYMSADPATGFIKMDLPDDVATHHYSIKFYDGRQRLVTEVPHINNAHVLFDKRNFPGKGLYKFVLRMDVTELESGYISIR